VTIKSKLLAAIQDMQFDDLSNEALIDVLLDKLKRQKFEIESLRVANIREREDLRLKHDRIDREYRELQRNPNKFISTQAHFLTSNNNKLQVTFVNGYIKLQEMDKKLAVWREVMQVSYADLMETK